MAATLVASTGGVGPVASAQSACTFQLGFRALHDAIPQIVGDCRGDEVHDSASGDAVQATSGGLLVWRKADNWTAFTDGVTTWIDGPSGLVSRPNEGPPFPWEAAAASVSASGGGIEGRVVTGPTCPGPALDGGGCPDRPYRATVTVLDQRGQAVARVETDPAGQFRVPLAPGAYVVQPEAPGTTAYPVAKEQAVTVVAGQFTRVTIRYDTGLR
jgi:hypothetical protein